MKRFRNRILAITAAAVLLVPAILLAAENYKIDTAHTYVMFKINHLNIGNSYGRLNGPTGSFAWDDVNPSNSRFEVTVPAANVDTDNDKRDKHIRSADFLDADTHRTLAFKSSGIKKTGPGTYEISGQLDLLGQSHPITVTAMETGHGKDPWGNYRRGFETTFTIKRSRWGMNFMQNGLGDDVEITVSLEGIRQ